MPMHWFLQLRMLTGLMPTMEGLQQWHAFKEGVLQVLIFVDRLGTSRGFMLQTGLMGPMENRNSASMPRQRCELIGEVVCNPNTQIQLNMRDSTAPNLNHGDSEETHPI